MENILCLDILCQNVNQFLISLSEINFQFSSVRISLETKVFKKRIYHINLKYIKENEKFDFFHKGNYIILKKFQ